MERWTTVDREELGRVLRKLKQATGSRPVTFLCIGTDRSTGDALGPLVGTGLAAAGVGRVIGTLASPCDANTLPELAARLASPPPGSERERGIVIAVDAALGKAESVGKFQVTSVPMLPGASLGRNLPQVGDYGIAGIVNAKGGNTYAILQNTSLYRVISMADDIVAAVVSAFRAT